MVAHDLSAAAVGSIGIDGRHLVDKNGRVLLLRGVNVAGVSKLPAVPDETATPAAAYTHPERVSFVNRPFPLNEVRRARAALTQAPEHCARLRAWGLTLVRLLVTWEALSHDGPCPAVPIDADYVAYLRGLLAVMAAYGIKCIVCAHQDVWSRWSGGSGAPAWTLRAAGLDAARLHVSGAALVPAADGPLLDAQPAGNKAEPTGPFNWPSGYQKMAPATMATLFWGGRVFAPRLCLREDNAGRTHDAEHSPNIQDVLQDAYIEAYGQLADAVADMDAVAGFEPMNEPHRGYISLYSFDRWRYETDLHIGHYPSALQGMALADGRAQSIPFYVKSWPFPSRRSHRSRVDPGPGVWLPTGASAPMANTRTARGCVWREHGVWTWDTAKQKPVVLQSDYFSVDPRPGQNRRAVEWYADFYAPFVRAFAGRIQRAAPQALMLVEPIPNEFMPRWDTAAAPAGGTRRGAHAPAVSGARPANMVYAPHFYDLNVLFFKAYNGLSVNVQGLSRGMFLPRALYFGAAGLARNYRHQLTQLCRRGYEALGEVPILIGEVGIPYDVNESLRQRPGDYRVQTTLMGALVSALERSLVSFTLWNYNPSNTVAAGNMEDFSIVNLEPRAADARNRARDSALYRGGRALDAIIRPYACKVAGVPCATRWDDASHTLHFRWRNVAQCASQTTEVFIPSYIFDAHPHAQVSDGYTEYRREEQTLYVHHTNHAPGFVHRLVVTGAPGRASAGRNVLLRILFFAAALLGLLVAVAVMRV
ncbi:hypothetical protein MSPP1_001562 [Malassezia sp. CBS 17886]|nr:hypothetical protein MSPP1_001562 [Malassezia sp. CBS 17886]